MNSENLSPTNDKYLIFFCAKKKSFTKTYWDPFVLCFPVGCWLAGRVDRSKWWSFLIWIVQYPNKYSNDFMESSSPLSLGWACSEHIVLVLLVRKEDKCLCFHATDLCWNRKTGKYERILTSGWLDKPLSTAYLWSLKEFQPLDITNFLVGYCSDGRQKKTPRQKKSSITSDTKRITDLVFFRSIFLSATGNLAIAKITEACYFI